MINAKLLSQGFLPNTLGTLYTAPSASTYVRYFSLYNAGITNEAILINISGSISSTIGRLELNVSESALMLAHGETITLSTGDKIQGVTTTASTIQFVIAGGEE